MDSARSNRAGFFLLCRFALLVRPVTLLTRNSLYTGSSPEPQKTGRRAMTFQILDIDHVVIRTADLDVMTRFYRDVLGCTLEREQLDIGLIQLRAGRSLIDLLQVGGKIDRPESGAPGAGRNMDHVCLRVEPFDAGALRTWFAARDVRIGEEAQRYGADGYGPSLYLFDPEGNMVELKGPPAGKP
jgi:glyoxylase I family protein